MQKVCIKYVKSIGLVKCLRHYGGLTLRSSPPSRAASRPGGSAPPRGIEKELREFFTEVLIVSGYMRTLEAKVE